MIKSIAIKQYGKLKDICFNFVPGINIISGDSGTCKTSILHIASNAFKYPVKKLFNAKNYISCIDIIKKINHRMNPKIENLTLGDNGDGNPAKWARGTLFTVDYFGDKSIEFRKYNSKITNRYAIRPYYRNDESDKLPHCPVIYLGLSRLFPRDEYEPIANSANFTIEAKKHLPEKYLGDIIDIYKEFTNLTIFDEKDNLSILITAIVSLKYYYETTKTESVLIIDEMEAALDPRLQFKMEAALDPRLQFKFLEKLTDYAGKYKIQVIATTHSVSLLEYALNKKANVIYLLEDKTSVFKMPYPDIYAIKTHLCGIAENNIYNTKIIPIFTEDDEARLFLKIIFDYFEDKKPGFSNIRGFFYLVEASAGAPSLKTIFSDTYLLTSVLQPICVLDSDQISNSEQNTIILPGQASPEKLIMEYSIKIYNENANFWNEQATIDGGYTRKHYRKTIRPDIEAINAKLERLKSEKKSVLGVKRKANKQTFIRYKVFFELLFKYWLKDKRNAKSIGDFYTHLFNMFKKTARFHGINPDEWSIAVR